MLLFANRRLEDVAWNSLAFALIVGGLNVLLGKMDASSSFLDVISLGGLVRAYLAHGVWVKRRYFPRAGEDPYPKSRLTPIWYLVVLLELSTVFGLVVTVFLATNEEQSYAMSEGVQEVPGIQDTRAQTVITKAECVEGSTTVRDQMMELPYKNDAYETIEHWVDALEFVYSEQLNTCILIVSASTKYRAGTSVDRHELSPLYIDMGTGNTLTSGQSTDRRIIETILKGEDVGEVQQACKIARTYNDDNTNVAERGFPDIITSYCDTMGKDPL